jgi:branched-chain amino acid transport system permease protein
MQIILNSFSNASPLIMLALAFQLVYLPTRIFFLALAAIISISPYLFKTLQPYFGLVTSALLTTLLCGSISLLIKQLNHSPLERKGASHGIQLISSLAIYVITTQFLCILFTSEVQLIELQKTGREILRIGNDVITVNQIVAVLLATGLTATLVVTLSMTKLGISFRALADDAHQFELFGHSKNQISSIAFFLSGCIAGLAALISGVDRGFDPYSGLGLLLLAVVAVIIGGRGSFIAPVLGAVVVSVLREITIWHFSAKWQDIASFVTLIAFLMIRSDGIYHKQTRLEVK